MKEIFFQLHIKKLNQEIEVGLMQIENGEILPGS